MRTLITGGEGQLGVDLLRRFRETGDVDNPDLDRLDVTSRSDVERYFDACRPDVVIHAAAWTDVDGCEKNEAEAFRVNENGSLYVAEACRRSGARLVAVSTDFVFRGDKDRAYTEEDKPDPISVYGRSKFAGERAVVDTLPGAAVARTAWLYGEGGTGNFVRSILAAADAGRALRVVDDQIGSPTFTADVADALFRIVEKRGEGVFHVVNSGETTRYGFARAILDLSGRGNVPVEAVRTGDYPLPAPRPALSTLANERMPGLGIPPLRDWKEALEDYLGRIR